VVLTPNSTTQALVVLPPCFSVVDDQYAIAFAAGKNVLLICGVVVWPSSLSDCSSFTFGIRQSSKPAKLSPSAYRSPASQVSTPESACCQTRPLVTSVIVPFPASTKE
jgi:hypothetical protein